MEIKQNTLYITTQGCYVTRDHLTLKVEVEKVVRLVVPIHHLESVCIFGHTMFSPSAAQLCWENGVAVNYFSENGFYIGKWEGVPNTSVMLRRTQFRKADDPVASAHIARQIIAGKIQNSRQSILRSARETESESCRSDLHNACGELSRLLLQLHDLSDVNGIRGIEGMAAQHYFSVFSQHLRQQAEEFCFSVRTRRPPLDRMNCLLSFLYAMVRHDCIAALSSTGLDPFVGFLHVDRPNRPSLALDLMEEFRPMLADRLAITLVNRRQVTKKEFIVREGGAVELTDSGRKVIVKLYQERKQDKVTHPLLGLTPRNHYRSDMLPFPLEKGMD